MKRGMTRYTVDPIEQGAQRTNYADHIYRYRVTCEWFTGEDWEPISVTEVPQLRHEWMVRIAKAVCRPFREIGDDDCISGIEAYMSATLRSISYHDGILDVEIRRPYTG